MSLPAVSVLMPVYNGERFLRSALGSVLEQTFSDFELVVVDDGSTDHTEVIVRSFRDRRIRFFRNETNLGITAALNYGIDLCRAPLIARMDADDVSDPARLEHQVSFMRANPGCALLSTWARVVTEDGVLVRLERYPPAFYHYNMTFECWMYHSTVMYRAWAVKEIGKYKMAYSEDYDLFWRMSSRYRIANLPLPLVDYRLSQTSLHSVRKKEEYSAAERANVLRNIRHYMGIDFTLPHHWLECLRHNFVPMIEVDDPGDLLTCLDLLASITDKIAGSGNLNVVRADIERAHLIKRNFILKEVARGMRGQTRRLTFLAEARAWSAMAQAMKDGISWRWKKQKRLWQA